MSLLLEAARRTSGVAHMSSTYAQVGTVAAGALAALFVVGTGGLGAGVLLAAGGAALTWGSAGGFVGGLLDDLGEASITERISTGVPDVFIDEPKLEATNASPACITDGDGEPVKTGSDSVFIHLFPASCITDELECGGIIKEGSSHVFYGGDRTSLSSQPSKQEPMWLQVFGFAATVVGLGQSPKSWWGFVSYGANALGFATEIGVLQEDPAPIATKSVQGIDTLLLVAESLTGAK